MTGVEILTSNQNEITLFNNNVFWISAIIAFIICLAIGFALSMYYQDIGLIILFLFFGIVIALMTGGMLGDHFGIHDGYETEYKVIISDEVLMNDFLEKYEILNQDGKIYTVKEKEEIRGESNGQLD